MLLATHFISYCTLRRMGVSDSNFASSWALVTDGLWRKSLSAIRSLGKSGFQVRVMGDTRATTGFWSSYARAHAVAPLAANNPDQFGDALLTELGRASGTVLLPMEDASLEWVCSHRREVSDTGAMALLPTREALGIARDKAKTATLAQELGIVCPRTWEPRTPEELHELAAQQKAGQWVVKPRSGSGSGGVVYPEAARSLAEWRTHWERFGPLLAQERVPSEGAGLGVGLLFDGSGACVASFVHRRLQQYPNSGGPSTDRESIRAPELIERSTRLMARLGWRGIAMVEWKEDPRTKEPKLMEINPRFWGSLELAVRSGIDFPSLYARAALGEKLSPSHHYEAGVRCRWMIPGEILRILSQPRKKREGLWKFLKGLPHIAEEWDPRDLRGFISTLLCTAALAFNPRYWKYVRRG
jgi:predicted ATP-grasp superfamily ATP-dependent carboligase